MSRNLARTIQNWMLPVAIVLGISLYLAYRGLPFLHPAGHTLHWIASEGQRTVIALLLFFQFVKVSPHDLQPRKWHIYTLLFQVVTFLALAAITVFAKSTVGRILLECAMLCLICPTAAAAGVVTEKLGGSLAETITYVVIINVAATFLIPMVIPLVRPSAELGFWAYVGHIALKIFPVLILPAIVAWTIRYTTHKLQRILMRLSRYTFYIWGVGLTLAMVLATRALILSNLPLGAVALVVAVSMAACALQFAYGRFIGRRLAKGNEAVNARSGKALGEEAECTTVGQAMGQKNTGFLIGLGYNYMTPVTSVAGGLYAIWQNLFNSWELYRKGRADARAARTAK